MTTGVQSLTANSLIERLHKVLEVGEQVGVRKMLVCSDEFAVDANVKLTVVTGDKGEGRDVLADPR